MMEAESAPNQGIPRLSPFNPLDHWKLLSWLFTAKDRLDAYRAVYGDVGTRPTAAWLASLLLWIPFVIFCLPAILNSLPRQEPVSLPLALGFIVIGFVVTGWLGNRPAKGLESKVREPVSEFQVAFGLTLGVVIGATLIIAVTVNGVAMSAFYSLLFVLAMGLVIGIASRVADEVALGGGFILAPIIVSVLIIGMGYGIMFVLAAGGAFLVLFVVGFGAAFIVQPLVSLLRKFGRQSNQRSAIGWAILGLGLLADLLLLYLSLTAWQDVL
jgi:hypothetical protein